MVDICECGGCQVERALEMDWKTLDPSPGVLRKNVILLWLRARVAQECDCKGVVEVGSVRRGADAEGEEAGDLRDGHDCAGFIGAVRHGVVGVVRLRGGLR